MRGVVGWTTLLTGGCLVANPVYVDVDDNDPEGSGTGGTASVSTTDADEGPGPQTSAATGSDTTPDTGDAEPPTDNWWDTAWNYRQKIIWEAADLELATNVIVRVDINPQSGEDHFLPGGDDVRFVTDQGEVLIHELERWDDLRGLAWVRVPRVGDPMPTRLFMYHGNPSAPPPALEYPFGDAFTAVWHLSSDVDSSGRNNTLTLGNPDLVDARIWLGLEFTDGSAPTTVDDPADFDNLPANGTTISGWLRLSDSTSERMTVYASVSGQGDGLEVHAGVIDGSMSLLVRRTIAGSFYEARADLPEPKRGWWYFAARYSDENGASFFVDGEDLDLASETSLVSGTSQQGLVPSLGGSAVDSAAALLGVLDEFRVSNQRLDRPWLRADYRSAAGTLLSLDAIATKPE